MLVLISISLLKVHFHIFQALVALKKGAQLLKYGRKGKPKCYPFRLSNVRLTYHMQHYSSFYYHV